MNETATNQPEPVVTLIEQLRRKREAMAKAALEGHTVSDAEHRVLLEGFNTPFWNILSREFKIRKASLAAKMRNTPPTNENLPTIYEALAEINVWEFLLDLPRVESEQRR